MSYDPTPDEHLLRPTVRHGTPGMPWGARQHTTWGSEEASLLMSAVPDPWIGWFSKEEEQAAPISKHAFPGTRLTRLILESFRASPEIFHQAGPHLQQITGTNAWAGCAPTCSNGNPAQANTARHGPIRPTSTTARQPRMHAGGATQKRCVGGQQYIDDEERRLNKQDEDQNTALFNEYLLKMQRAIRQDYSMRRLKEDNFPRYRQKLQELEDRLVAELEGKVGCQSITNATLSTMYDIICQLEGAIRSRRFYIILFSVKALQAHVPSLHSGICWVPGLEISTPSHASSHACPCMKTCR